MEPQTFFLSGSELQLIAERTSAWMKPDTIVVVEMHPSKIHVSEVTQDGQRALKHYIIRDGIRAMWDLPQEAIEK